jgi:hypothetical protein
LGHFYFLGGKIMVSLLIAAYCCYLNTTLVDMVGSITCIKEKVEEISG